MKELTDDYGFPRSGIHKYVSAYIRNLPDLTGKIVIDIPCGDGRAGHEFCRKGARVRAFDLYPEFMKVKGIEAQYADLMDGIPMEDNSADFLICQEGIEHMPDQTRTLREFNRVLKKGGELIITTPNLSHLRARLSMFFVESDLWRRMPPTEIDSVWFSEKESNRLYFGHLFLLGVHHLQTLCSISGFEVEKRIRTDIGNTSLVLSVFAYPFLALTTWLSWLLYRNKNEHVGKTIRDRILRDRVALNLSPTTLICKHVFWVLRKTREYDEAIADLKLMTRKEEG